MIYGIILKRNLQMLKILKSSVLGKFTKSHNKLSHKLTMGGYKIAQKWIGFN